MGHSAVPAELAAECGPWEGSLECVHAFPQRAAAVAHALGLRGNAAAAIASVYMSDEESADIVWEVGQREGLHVVLVLVLLIGQCGAALPTGGIQTQ